MKADNLNYLTKSKMKYFSVLEYSYKAYLLNLTPISHDLFLQRLPW